MNIIRKIPATMGTQHPDHAAIPFWHTEAFIPAGKEVIECFLSYSELGISEYMWDWEGKLVDEAVLDRLFIEYGDYFRTHQLGKDKFLTFRLPNPKVETEYRLARAFIGMMNASALARHMDYGHDPLFEVILPMTESAHEMIEIQQAFRELSSLKHPLLKFEETSFTHIELIPLFETIDTIAGVNTILKEYLDIHEKKFAYKPPYIRVFLARSDPALNSGILPTVLSLKIGLSKLAQFGDQFGIPIYPILGAAALPFRGGLTPYTYKSFLKEYAGIRTTTIQSGFKYDYPKNDVIKAIAEIEQLLERSKAPLLSDSEVTMMTVAMHESEKLYQQSIESIAAVVNDIARYLPKRRDRVQHVGLFGYSRGVGKVTLPRAIGFTGSLYSLGIPPEIIATGRTIKNLVHQGAWDVIRAQYINLADDIKRSGHYVNHDVLNSLVKVLPGFVEIQEDIHALEQHLDIEFGSQTEDEKEHELLTTKIYKDLQNGSVRTEDIERAAVLRKSLG